MRRAQRHSGGEETGEMGQGLQHQRLPGGGVKRAAGLEGEEGF